MAAKYAHRFPSEYDVVWWVSAEHVGRLGEQFAALANVLGCAGAHAGTAVMQQAVLAELRSGIGGCWFSTMPRSRRR